MVRSGAARAALVVNIIIELSRESFTFAKIATECRQNHGAALKAYLERIVLAEFDVAEVARNATSTFVGHVVESGDGAVARDVAAKFGLVYAGGMLGIRFGIVPWQADELLDEHANEVLRRLA
jgi:putative DNA primase/helicase